MVLVDFGVDLVETGVTVLLETDGSQFLADWNGFSHIYWRIIPASPVWPAGRVTLTGPGVGFQLGQPTTCLTMRGTRAPCSNGLFIEPCLIHCCLYLCANIFIV